MKITENQIRRLIVTSLKENKIILESEEPEIGEEKGLADKLEAVINFLDGPAEISGLLAAGAILAGSFTPGLANKPAGVALVALGSIVNKGVNIFDIGKLSVKLKTGNVEPVDVFDAVIAGAAEAIGSSASSQAELGVKAAARQIRQYVKPKAMGLFQRPPLLKMAASVKNRILRRLAAAAVVQVFGTLAKIFNNTFDDGIFASLAGSGNNMAKEISQKLSDIFQKISDEFQTKIDNEGKIIQTMNPEGDGYKIGGGNWMKVMRTYSAAYPGRDLLHWDTDKEWRHNTPKQAVVFVFRNGKDAGSFGVSYEDAKGKAKNIIKKGKEENIIKSNNPNYIASV